MDTRILQLIEGARNCVSGLAGIKKGDKVLVVTDIAGFADPLVVEAIALANEEAGAELVIATCDEFESRLQEPPDIIQKAFLGADTVFLIMKGEAIIHTRAGRIAMREYGVNMINIVANTPELLASEWARFPMELFWAISARQYELVQRGKTIRVTSENGTDCTATVPPDHWIMALPHQPARGDGIFYMWPTGIFGLMPWTPGKGGTLVFDGIVGEKGLLKSPVRVTVEGHSVSRIEGGEEASRFADLMADKKHKGVVDADLWTEIMWGLNPKASIRRGLEMMHVREAEITRRAGTLHFGIGPGRGFHWDGLVFRPSVFVDGVPVIEKGRLTALDDPEIIRLAAKFGDTDELLAELPE